MLFKIMIFFFGGLAVFSTNSQANTYEVEMVLMGIQSDKGSIRSVLCTSQENFPNSCIISNVSKPESGVVKIKFQNISEGIYAFAAFHDEDDNSQLNIGANRMPSEGLAFSNNALGRMGPPNFKQSAFEVTKDTKQMAKFRYFK